MTGHVERTVEEKQALDARISELESFIESDKAKEIGMGVEILKIQLAKMKDYSYYLDMRIKLYNY